MFADLGAQIVEGDEMGKRALNECPALREKLAHRFDNQILDDSGQIIRTRLAEAAFATKWGRRDLTSITFPFLYDIAKREFDKKGKLSRLVIFDAALIFEWQIEEDFDGIIVVTAPEEMLIHRVCSRLSIPLQQAKQRLQAQIPPTQKARNADYVIENTGSILDLKQRVRDVWDKIA